MEPKQDKPPQSRRSVITLVLATCGVIVGWANVWALKPETQAPYLIIAAVALIASLIQDALSLLAPSLYGTGKPSFPRNITLPIVYAALLIMCSVMWLNTGTGSSLVQRPEAFDFLKLWTKPPVILTVVTLQVVCLSLMARRSR